MHPRCALSVPWELQLPTGTRAVYQLGSGPGSPHSLTQSQLSAAPRSPRSRGNVRPAGRVWAQPWSWEGAATELMLLGMEACAALDASASLSVLTFASTCFFNPVVRFVLLWLDPWCHP